MKTSYNITNIEGFSDNKTIIASGLDSARISSGKLTISNYAYGVNFPVSQAKWVWN